MKVKGIQKDIFLKTLSKGLFNDFKLERCFDVDVNQNIIIFGHITYKYVIFSYT